MVSPGRTRTTLSLLLLLLLLLLLRGAEENGVPTTHDKDVPR
jgi:hypothetical protein